MIWGISAKMNVAEITVLGVGNILLGDEGVGVRAVEQLQKEGDYSAAVQLLDGGTLGMELLRFLKGTKRLLLLDAVQGDQKPGTLYCLRDSEVEAHLSGALSVHDLGLKDVLAVLKLLEAPVEEVVLLGVQPQTLAVGMELSEPVSEALTALIQAACTQVRQWQAEVALHG
nr:HyaD/HybD family hydrogenase maturation endopeptidase [uncultured Anaeromusa sp.]